jgi:hypothetical protein
LALNRIGSGFPETFAGGEVSFVRLLIVALHSDGGGAEIHQLNLPRHAHESNRGVHVMIAAGQALQHRSGLSHIGGLPKHVVIQLDNGIAPQDNGSRLLHGDRPGLADGESFDLLDCGLIGRQLFIERGASHFEGNIQEGQQLAPAR